MNVYRKIGAILICFTSILSARQVFRGENIWKLQKQVTEASCDATITNDNFTAGLLTIINSGVYCFAEPLTGEITIAASDVVLDLNGKNISGGSNGVVVDTNMHNVTIKNGTIGPASNSGVLIKAGCSDIAVEEVKIKDCVEGIRFEDSSNSFVQNCDLVSNTTGLTLDQSHKIIVDKCTAFCNELAGYSLIISDTNCFRECKALSTGEGATGDDTNVYGFITDSGAGNIFENCIANATQALTSTIDSAVAAGFAFTGTERCSKIINCESANVTTAANGISIPYGILLQSRFDLLQSVTTANTGGDDTVASVNWSPDGKFLAVGGVLTDEDVRVFQFDRLTPELIEVATAISVPGNVFSVNWSPDGKFLAVGGALTDEDVRVFEFNRSTLTLTEVATAIPGMEAVESVNWSPDGKFLAVGGALVVGDNVRVLEFNRSTLTLTEVATAISGGNTVFSVNWSSDGKFLAVGGLFTGDNVRVLEFNRSTLTLTEVATDPGTGTVFSVNWSPDGKFLAVGGDLTDEDVRVFEFDRSTLTLTQVTEALSGSNNVLSVNWTPNGKFLAVGGALAEDDVRVFEFNRSTLTLIEVASAPAPVAVLSVNWSPDGKFLAVGGFLTEDDVRIFEALKFPSKNIIKDNVVYCVEGNKCPAGIGISGSSINNLIIGNTAYNNVTNYEFVTNAFDQRFGQAPSLLQNIGIEGCEPICMPEDVVCIVKQNRDKIDKNSDKICDIQSKIDILLALH